MSDLKWTVSDENIVRIEAPHAGPRDPVIFWLQEKSDKCQKAEKATCDFKRISMPHSASGIEVDN
jgi:hypothetical protein